MYEDLYHFCGWFLMEWVMLKSTMISWIHPEVIKRRKRWIMLTQWTWLRHECGLPLRGAGGEHPRGRPHHLHLPPPHGLPLPLCQVICLLKMSMSRDIWTFNGFFSPDYCEGYKRLLAASRWQVGLAISAGSTHSPTCKWASYYTQLFLPASEKGKCVIPEAA